MTPSYMHRYTDFIERNMHKPHDKTNLRLEWNWWAQSLFWQKPILAYKELHARKPRFTEHTHTNTHCTQYGDCKNINNLNIKTKRCEEKTKKLFNIFCCCLTLIRVCSLCCAAFVTFFSLLLSLLKPLPRASSSFLVHAAAPLYYSHSCCGLFSMQIIMCAITMLCGISECSLLVCWMQFNLLLKFCLWLEFSINKDDI